METISLGDNAIGHLNGRRATIRKERVKDIDLRIVPSDPWIAVAKHEGSSGEAIR
jgi:hypothetical protein